MMTLLAHLPLTDIGLALAIFALGLGTGYAIAKSMFARSK